MKAAYKKIEPKIITMTITNPSVIIFLGKHCNKLCQMKIIAMQILAIWSIYTIGKTIYMGSSITLHEKDLVKGNFAQKSRNT